MTLNHREKTDDGEQDAGNDNAMGEIGSLSVDESIGLTTKQLTLTDDENHTPKKMPQTN